MSTPQEAMYKEAISAIHSGDRARARDLLTRLLKTQPDNAEFWVWMSAVVETAKERAYCLKEALRYDPHNAAATRGLVLMGMLPPDPAQVLPSRLQKRNWRAKMAEMDGVDPAQAQKPRKPQMALMGAAFLVLAGLVGFALWGAQRQNNRPFRMPVINLPTNTALAGAAMTATPPARSHVSSGTPDPLWMQLKATYTPTPLYINTPHSVTEAYSIGMRAFNRGDFANAVTYLSQAVPLTTNAPDVLFYLGESYRMQGKYTTAIDTYNKTIQQDPDFAASYYGRAMAVLASNPKRSDAILQDLQTAIDKDPNFTDAYYGMAQMHLQAGQPQDALTALESVAKDMPNSPRVYLYRAQAYLAMHDARQALSNASQARQLDITLLEAYRVQGMAMQAEGDFESSIEPLKTYLLYQSGDAQAWTALARAYLKNQQASDAQQALNKALQLDNRLVDAYLLRGQLLLDRKSPSDALDDFKAALRLNSDSFEASLGIGEALMGQNYSGDAYTQFEKTQSLAKEDLQKAELLYWTALSLDKLGELRTALSDYQALVALPASSVKQEWVDAAQARIAALVTPTPTSKPRTATPTPTATRTPQPTQTRWPTATSHP